MTTNTHHTPGPWTAVSGEIVSDTRYIATIYDWSNPGQCAPGYAEINAGLRAESEANARLIAAAPELLAALRNAEHVATKNAEHGSADWAFVRDSARAAIAKAEGRA